MKYRFAVFTLLVGCLLMNASLAEDKQTTLKIGDQAPAFNFRLLDGSAGPQLADFKGQVVILDFWATWCPPCIKSIPHLNQLQEEFKGRPVHFFSITYETAGMVGPFLEKHKPQVPIGLDNDFAMFKSYGSWGIPTLYLIDGNGIIASVTGPQNVTAEVIEQLLAGKVPDVPQYKGWQDPEGAEEYFRSLLAKGK